MNKFRRNISWEVIKRLLARSGNRCAFANCSHPIFTNENMFVSQLCHIEAVAPGGPRYNPNKSEDEINSYDNLLFLCYRHHRETDNAKVFDVAKLKAMKAEHESKFQEHPFLINDDEAKHLAADIEKYWNMVDQLNNLQPEEVRIEINNRLQVMELLSEMRLALDSIKSFNGFLQNSVGNKEFETLFIGIPNWLTRLEVLIHQTEVKYLEEKTIQNPGNRAIRDDYELARALFAIITPNKGLAE